MSEFEIPVRELDAAGKTVTFPVRAEWLKAALETGDVHPAGPDGKLEVRLSKSGTDVVVRGRVQATLETACARCLKPATVAIDQELSALMVPGKAEPNEEGEYEFTADEADVLPYDGETVVLDDLVRDELLLEVPMIPLCSPDCAGMSPPPQKQTEEESHGIDPRLAPLLKLKKAQKE